MSSSTVWDETRVSSKDAGVLLLLLLQVVVVVVVVVVKQGS
jgi:hypothetical protein